MTTEVPEDVMQLDTLLGRVPQLMKEAREEIDSLRLQLQLSESIKLRLLERQNELLPICLFLADMNEEKAAMMRDDQPALREFFKRNAETLRKVAGR